METMPPLSHIREQLMPNFIKLDKGIPSNNLLTTVDYFCSLSLVFFFFSLKIQLRYSGISFLSIFLSKIVVFFLALFS